MPTKECELYASPEYEEDTEMGNMPQVCRECENESVCDFLAQAGYVCKLGADPKHEEDTEMGSKSQTAKVTFFGQGSDSSEYEVTITLLGKKPFHPEEFPVGIVAHFLVDNDYASRIQIRDDNSKEIEEWDLATSRY